MTATRHTTRQAQTCISLGKRRGLQSLSTPEHVFAVLAVDHIAALSAVARPQDPDSLSTADLVSLKLQLVETLAPCASGILIDAVLGLEPMILGDVLPNPAGLMVGLEDGDHASLTSAPRLFADWNVSRAAASGAAAIKCSFLYDPFAPSDAAHRFVEDLVADCDKHGLPLFAEPLTPQSQISNKRSVVIATAKNIGALGVDILKLEFPLDEQADESAMRDAGLELTEASPVPWTLLSGGADFDTFACQLEIACKAGASGYVAGRTVWKDLVSQHTPDLEGAAEDAVSRLSRLTAIAVAHGTPWSNWYGPTGADSAGDEHERPATGT